MARRYGRYFPTLLLAVAALLSGCDHRAANDGPAFISLAGTWTGTYQTSGGLRHPASLAIMQTANVATGSYDLDLGVRTGTLQGSVDGNNATLTLKPIAGCTGSFTMSTGTQGTTMQIFLNGTDCHGTISNATGTLTKT